MPNRCFLCLFLAGSIAIGLRAASPGWSQFRGPRFDNNFPGQQLPAEFGPDKNLAWKVEIPSGHGSLCVVGDRIFLTAFDGKDTLETLAVSRRDGAILWRQAVKPAKLEPYFAKLGSPATSTCASDGRRVVSYFGPFGLICHDLDDKGAPYVASPLYHDGRLYLIKTGGLLTVYEGAGGKVLLDKERLGVVGDYYASPIAAGGKIYIASLNGTLLTLKPGDKPEVVGKIDLGESIAATPAVVDNTLYVRAGGHLWAFR